MLPVCSGGFLLPLKGELMMKYVILDIGRHPVCLMFNDGFKHADAASAYCKLQKDDDGHEYGENYGEYPEVIGAGFVTLRKDGLVVCSGKSTSLYRDKNGTPTESRGVEDAEELVQTLNGSGGYDGGFFHAGGPK
jgi:hypothetical protein